MSSPTVEPVSRVLRFPDVIHRTGLSKSAIYQRIRSEEFPAPVVLGPRAIGFIECEVDGWLRALTRQRHSCTTPQEATH